MGDTWLDCGHGDGLSLVPVQPAPPIGATEARPSGSPRPRSSGAVVATIAIVALIASVGTAYAVRETLFPSLGAPTARSVWQNPVVVDDPVDDPADDPVAVTSPSTTTSTTTSTMPTTSTSLPVSTSAPTVTTASRLGVPTSTSDDATGSDSDDVGLDISVPDAPDIDEPDDSQARSDDSGSGSDDSGSGSDDSSGSDSTESSSGRSQADDADDPDG